MESISESDLERLLVDEEFLNRVADKVAQKMKNIRTEQTDASAEYVRHFPASAMVTGRIGVLIPRDS